MKTTENYCHALLILDFASLYSLCTQFLKDSFNPLKLLLLLVIFIKSTVKVDNKLNIGKIAKWY